MSLKKLLVAASAAALLAGGAYAQTATRPLSIVLADAPTGLNPNGQTLAVRPIGYSGTNNIYPRDILAYNTANPGDVLNRFPILFAREAGRLLQDANENNMILTVQIRTTGRINSGQNVFMDWRIDGGTLSQDLVNSVISGSELAAGVPTGGLVVKSFTDPRDAGKGLQQGVRGDNYFRLAVLPDDIATVAAGGFSAPAMSGDLATAAVLDTMTVAIPVAYTSCDAPLTITLVDFFEEGANRDRIGVIPTGGVALNTSTANNLPQTIMQCADAYQMALFSDVDPGNQGDNNSFLTLRSAYTAATPQQLVTEPNGVPFADFGVSDTLLRGPDGEFSPLTGPEQLVDDDTEDKATLGFYQVVVEERAIRRLNPLASVNRTDIVGFTTTVEFANASGIGDIDVEALEAPPMLEEPFFDVPGIDTSIVGNTGFVNRRLATITGPNMIGIGPRHNIGTTPAANFAGPLAPTVEAGVAEPWISYGRFSLVLSPVERTVQAQEFCINPLPPSTPTRTRCGAGNYRVTGNLLLNDGTGFRLGDFVPGQPAIEANRTLGRDGYLGTLDDLDYDGQVFGRYDWVADSTSTSPSLSVITSEFRVNGLGSFVASAAFPGGAVPGSIVMSNSNAGIPDSVYSFELPPAPMGACAIPTAIPAGVVCPNGEARLDSAWLESVVGAPFGTADFLLIFGEANAIDVDRALESQVAGRVASAYGGNENAGDQNLLGNTEPFENAETPYVIGLDIDQVDDSNWEEAQEERRTYAPIFP